MALFQFSRPMHSILEVDKASNGRRHVDRWLPIHSWTVEQVWERIAVSGVPSHPAYEFMPRLSCSFCVLASKGALVAAAQRRPELAGEYLRIENKLGHSFRKDLSMAQIIEEAERALTPVTIDNWKA